MTYIQKLMDLSIRINGIFSILKPPLPGGGMLSLRRILEENDVLNDVNLVAFHTYISDIFHEIETLLSSSELPEPMEWFALPSLIKREILGVDERMYARLASHIENFDQSIEDLCYDTPCAYEFLGQPTYIQKTPPVIQNLFAIQNKLQQIKVAKELETLGYVKAADTLKNIKNENDVNEMFFRIYDDITPLLPKLPNYFYNYIESAKQIDSNYNM